VEPAKRSTRPWGRGGDDLAAAGDGVAASLRCPSPPPFFGTRGAAGASQKRGRAVSGRQLTMYYYKVMNLSDDSNNFTSIIILL